VPQLNIHCRVHVCRWMEGSCNWGRKGKSPVGKKSRNRIAEPSKLSEGEQKELKMWKGLARSHQRAQKKSSRCGETKEKETYGGELRNKL